MQFQVPQYIEVEDKIFGPFTIKQFVYLAGGGAMCFILIRLLPTFLGIFLSIPIAAFAVALAFYKVNNKPFIEVVEHAFSYALKDKLYIWKKQEKTPTSRKVGDENIDPLLYVPKLADSKLKDMTWSLDVASAEILNPVTKKEKK